MQHFSLMQTKKHYSTKEFREIDQQVRQAVKKLKIAESEVIHALQKVDQSRSYRWAGYNSLFQYCVQSLGLTENQAYNFIAVARKANECPQLQSAIDAGEITVSKARKITPVIEKGNQELWLNHARQLSTRELERQVACHNPKAQKPESLRFINDHELELNVTLNEDIVKKLKRVQTLLCQKQKAAIGLSQCIEVLALEYLAKNDPVEKAKRAQINQRKKANPAQTADQRNELKPNQRKQERELKEGKKDDQGNKAKSAEHKTNFELTTKKKEQIQRTKHQPKAKACHVTGTSGLQASDRNRRPLSQKLKHQIRLRDKDQCQYQMPNGSTCSESRWVEYHHRQPVAQGGEDRLDNLVTLCRGHHQAIHQQ